MAYTDRKDRNKVLDHKMAQLQQQLYSMERQLAEQAEIRHKVEQLQNRNETRVLQAVERANSKNMMLQEEIERFYNSPSPVSHRLLEDVMALRTKEFHKSQAKKAANIKYLAMERQKIMEARNRLREKNDTFRSLPSPIGGDSSQIVVRSPPPIQSPTYRSVHSTDSQVRRAVNAIPQTVDKIWSIREDLTQTYLTKKKPYNGEMGITSYNPWQLPDYYIVRKLVEDFVDDFIITHIPPDYVGFERSMKLEMIKHNEKEYHQTSTLLAERSAVKLVAEEIFLEVTSKLTQEIASEGIHQDLMFKRISANMFMKHAEIIATGNPNGRDPNERAYDLVTKSFTSLQKNRDHNKKDVWGHSQLMTHPGLPPPLPLKREAGPPIPVQPKSKKPDPADLIQEPLEPDVFLITYDHLCPEHLRDLESAKSDNKKMKEGKFWTKIYRKKELSYWPGMKPFSFKLNIPRHCDGVAVVCPSPDQMLVAIGGGSGDVLVYNTQVEPWQLVKIGIATAKVGAVVYLAWSLDSSRLLAVRQKNASQGTVHVWETKGEPPTSQDLSAVGLANTKGANLPFKLLLVHEFMMKKDFDLSAGALLEDGEGQGSDQVPVVGGFYPTYTFLTTQHDVCAGFTSGHIMKFDLGQKKLDAEASKPTIIFGEHAKVGEEGTNVSTQNLPVQLLRQHKHPLIHMGFVGNLGKMVTVDDKGFINLWKVDRDHLTGFDWFFPERKYKMSFAKTMYSPSSYERARVHFTDRKRSKTTSLKKIAAERNKAQKVLDRMQLGNPWHVSIDQPGLETSVYIPPGGTQDTGAMFNVVIRHRKSRLVSTYMTRMYRPVKVNCDKLLSVVQSPSGTDLIFILLFPEYPPKGAHLMVVSLHLPTMKLHDFRADINVTREEQREIMDGNSFSASCTQVFGPTGASYLFMTLRGRVFAVSLNTGTTILRMDSVTRPKDPEFKGLLLDKKVFALNKTHCIACVGNLGSMYAILFEKTSNVLTVLHLEDGNSDEDARLVWKACQKWPGHRPIPSELRINRMSTLLPDLKEKETEIRSMLLNLTQGQPTTPEGRFAAKVDNYSAAQSKVKDLFLMDGLI